jgi:hypothetical protein
VKIASLDYPPYPGFLLRNLSYACPSNGNNIFG